MAFAHSRSSGRDYGLPIALLFRNRMEYEQSKRNSDFYTECCTMAVGSLPCGASVKQRFQASPFEKVQRGE